MTRNYAVQKQKGPNGQYYAQVNGLKLHSPYNPAREAERFAKTKIQTKPSKILVLGPGLGYLLEACRKLFPEAQLLAVFYHIDFFNWYGGKTAESCLYENPAALSGFLRRNIHEIDLEGFLVLEWPGSGRIFSAISKLVNSVVRNVILELHSNFLTTESFGKKMLLNSVKNFLFHSNIVETDKINRPVLIAASGPSLENAVTSIRKYRDKFFLLSLPSSLELLHHHSIVPDAVITTDPGFYSGYHIFSRYRNFSQNLLTVKSFSAAVSPAVFSTPTMFLGWDPLFERDFLIRYYCSDKIIPETGTVAGTALELTLLLKSPAVFFAGLDFSYRDLLSHARPHSFYSLFLSQNKKTNPFHSVLFSRRISFFEKSNSFSAYRTWFSEKLKPCGTVFYRLCPSSVAIPGFKTIDESDFSKLLNSFSGFPAKFRRLKAGTLHERVKAVVGRIETMEEALGSFKKPEGPVSFSLLEEKRLLFHLLFTLDPITLKQYKSSLRKGEKKSGDIYSSLIHNTELFFISLKRWLTTV